MPVVQVNLKSGAEPFFKFVFLLFLALYCGESVVVMLSGMFCERLVLSLSYKS